MRTIQQQAVVRGRPGRGQVVEALEGRMLMSAGAVRPHYAPHPAPAAEGIAASLVPTKPAVASLTPAPPIVVDSLPPSPVFTSINDGTAQRSRVRSITISFDQRVTLEAGAFTLAKLHTDDNGTTDGGAPTDATVSLGPPVVAENGVNWTIPILPDTAFSDHEGSLVDGVYTLTIHGNHVSSQNGEMAVDDSVNFHRLFGDLNGNKTVNTTDYAFFRGSFGKTSPDAAYVAAFDFDGNGVINNLDYGQFRARFGKVLSYT